MTSVGNPLLELPDVFGADGVDGTPEPLDTFTKPVELLFTDPVIFSVSCLRVSLFQLLEHGALAAGGFGPDAVEAPVESFGERSEEGDIVVVGRVIGEREQETGV